MTDIDADRGRSISQLFKFYALGLARSEPNGGLSARVTSQQVIHQHLTSACEDVLLFPAR